jgi:biotin carboxyl carrier protein
VTETVPGALIVHVNGRPIVVRTDATVDGVLGRAGSPRPQRRTGAADAGPQWIVAPMPGRVAKVLVAVGDTVTARQGLVVVEAMKMENELRSSKAGVVTEVRVAEGARVDAHAVLVVVE